MNINEIKEKSDYMIKHFVDSLNLNGSFYIENTKCPVAVDNIGVPGMFLTAGSRELENYLNMRKVPKERQKYYLSEGLIVISNNLNQFDEPNVYVTIIHEKLHAGRMILLNTSYNDNREYNSVIYNNNRYEKVLDSNKPYYADASQEILRGSIDSSKKTINKFKEYSIDELEVKSFEDEKTNDKLYEQQLIDEALVELMAIISYDLYKNKSSNIMDTVKRINTKYKGQDIKAITNIILRHNDLELFKWMLDPLSYQLDDVHYDFFNNYLFKEDLEDIKIIKESEDLLFDIDGPNKSR